MGRILRDSELIAAPRHRHVDNVIPLHQASAATVYDQDRGGRRGVVVLTNQQAIDPGHHVGQRAGDDRRSVGAGDTFTVAQHVAGGRGDVVAVTAPIDRRCEVTGAPCGYRVWRETTWPNQWIGQCNRATCPGGIRCNDEQTAVDFKDSMHCHAATPDRQGNAT